MKRQYVVRRFIVLLAVLTSCFFVVQEFAPLGETSRFSGATIEKDPSASQRMLLWKATWEMFREGNVIVGSGIGTFPLMYPRYRPLGDESGGNFAHNDYLQALQEGGVIQFLFLFLLTIAAPTLLLLKAWRQREPEGVRTQKVEVVGYMLALLAVAAHATINFIHHILPIALLTGLYLARTHQLLQTPTEPEASAVPQRRVLWKVTRPVLYVLVVLPTLMLVSDALIFVAFAGKNPLVSRLDPSQRTVAMGLALSLRPSNMWPRERYIRSILEYLENMKSPPEKEAMAELAMHEISDAEKHAPGIPLWAYLRARTHLLTDHPDKLSKALPDLERAVRMAPGSFEFRLGLIRTQRALGKPEEAILVASAAKQWIGLTTDIESILELATEAEALARSLHSETETAYWHNVRLHILAIAKQAPTANLTN